MRTHPTRVCQRHLLSIVLFACIAGCLTSTVNALVPLNDATAVAGHCALRQSGEVWCWGSSPDLLNTDPTSPANLPARVNGLPQPLLALSSNGETHCVIHGSGAIWCWGRNDRGQAGQGSTSPVVAPSPVLGIDGTATQVSVGSKHSCARLSNGAVKCWGGNESGQLGDGSTVDSSSALGVLGLPGAISRIAAGGTHSCALTSDGAAWCWGDDVFGQLGDGATNSSGQAPVLASGLSSGVSQIAAGQMHSCAIVINGLVKCWGYNDYGQVGDGSTTHRDVPASASGMVDATHLSLSSWHSCALLENGQARCWGLNSGTLGDGRFEQSTMPVAVLGNHTFQQLASSLSSGVTSCGLRDDGQIWCWGKDLSPQGSGHLGDGGSQRVLVATRINAAGTSLRELALGGGHTCARSASGTARCWGANAEYQLGDGSGRQALQPVTANLPAAISSLTSGLANTCATLPSVTRGNVATQNLYCWGKNTHGQLGPGHYDTVQLPERVDSAGFEVASISMGKLHSCLTSGQSGTVSCSGVNLNGQSGRSNPDGSNEFLPSEFGLLDVVHIAAGGDHSCGLVGSGEVYCWGSDQSGQLGDGNATTDGGFSPVLVSGLPAPVIQIASGSSFSCALTQAGSVHCWGSNVVGQLGDGSNLARSAPVQVTGLTSGVVEIAASDFAACARRGNGSVRCWGANTEGNLGDGSTENRFTPVSVIGLSNAQSLAMGTTHACALDSGSRLFCWGNNEWGQLGLGNATSRSIPGPVMLQTLDIFNDGFEPAAP